MYSRFLTGKRNNRQNQTAAPGCIAFYLDLLWDSLRVYTVARISKTLSSGKHGKNVIGNVSNIWKKS